MQNRIKEHLDHDTPEPMEFDAFYLAGPAMEGDSERPEPSESVFIWDANDAEEHMEENPGHVCVHVVELYIPSENVSVLQTSNKVNLN